MIRSVFIIDNLVPKMQRLLVLREIANLSLTKFRTIPIEIEKEGNKLETEIIESLQKLTMRKIIA